MPIEPTMQAPRAGTAAVIAGGVTLGAGVAGATAVMLGADQPSLLLAVATVLVSGVAALLPAMLSGTVVIARWGMLALVGTMAQPMIVAALGFVFDKTRTLDRQAFWVGCLAGAMVLLITQVAWAITTLSKAQRAWEQSRPAKAGVSVSNSSFSTPHLSTPHLPTTTEAV